MFNRITLVFLFTACLSSSCQSEQSPIKEKETLSIVEKETQQDTVKTIEFVTNDDFVFGVLEKDLPFSFFRNHFKLIEQEVLRNKHTPAVNDTIFVFSNGLDTVNFYVAPSNIILQELSVNSPRITLDGNLSVGGLDEVLKKRFALQTLPDSLVIKDFENSSYFLFITEEGRIKKMMYKSRYFD